MPPIILLLSAFAKLDGTKLFLFHFNLIPPTIGRETFEIVHQKKSRLYKSGDFRSRRFAFRGAGGEPPRRWERLWGLTCPANPPGVFAPSAPINVSLQYPALYTTTYRDEPVFPTNDLRSDWKDPFRCCTGCTVNLWIVRSLSNWIFYWSYCKRKKL